MALFVYPREMRRELLADIGHAHKCGSSTIGIAAKDMRHTVRALMNHDLLLVPAQIAYHTANVERLKAVAHLCGIHVRPITTMTSNPTSAPAARHNQPGAGVGKA